MIIHLQFTNKVRSIIPGERAKLVLERGKMLLVIKMIDLVICQIIREVGQNYMLKHVIKNSFE